MTTAAFIRDAATAAHKAAARELATALARSAVEGTADAYEALEAALREHLDARECGMLAFAALRACEPRDLGAVLEGALPEPPAGMPDWAQAFFFDGEVVLEEAEAWAAGAFEEEVRAYAVACLARMPKAERAALMRAFEGSA